MGFNADTQNLAFFPDGRYRANFLVNLGHADPVGIYARAPRLPFDQVAQIDSRSRRLALVNALAIKAAGKPAAPRPSVARAAPSCDHQPTPKASSSAAAKEASGVH